MSVTKLALATMLVGSACRTPATSDRAADSAAVLAAAEDYRQSWLRGDTGLALGLVSDDIRILISGVPDIAGRQAVREMFVTEMNTYNIPTLDLNRQDLLVGGDYAVDVGTYAEVQAPKNGAPAIHHRGRYLTIWRREADRWRITRFMLNELPSP